MVARGLPATGERPLDNDILENLPDAIILLNAEREIIDANRSARELLVPGFQGRDLTVSLRHPELLEAVAKALSGADVPAIEISLSHPVARVFEIRVFGLPDSAAGEGPVAATLVLHDITAARQAEKLRSDFVANVSHELRSPLSALIGFIETLRGSARDDPEARERFLAMMAAEADRMARLIDDLLSLSAVEVNEHIRPADRVDLAHVLRVVIEILEVKARARDMAITLDLPDPVPVIVGDQDELIQVFQNLIDNAIKYGAPGRPIRVRVASEERIAHIGRPGLAVSVHNEGEGIAHEHLSRLTERFYRVDKGRSRSMGGTGLGLAIVKHIVNHHRGRLHIDSAPGEGATFTVYLPYGLEP